jgi:2-keto-3-deoxy-6-phosphogluconate aldolase
LNVEQAAAAVEAGARFIVALGLDLDIVGWCLERGVAVLPGVARACLTNGAGFADFLPGGDEL